MPKIAGSELAHLASTHTVGAPAASEVIIVSVILRPKTPLPTQAAGMPLLSREQFAAAHGADPAAIALVEGFARRQGFAVVEFNAARHTVMLSGTLDKMASAFGVRFANYSAAEVVYRGYEGAITIPGDLAVVVVAVLGLDNRPAAEPRVRVAPAAGLTTRAYTPIEVATAYGFPATSKGNGQCIGIIELGGGFHASDLEAFFGVLNLPVPQVVVVSVDGGTNSPDSPGGGDADFEVGLDIEVAGAVAPQARLAVYFAPVLHKGSSTPLPRRSTTL